MHTRLSEDSNRHSPQRWEGGVSIRKKEFGNQTVEIARRVWHASTQEVKPPLGTATLPYLGHSLVPEQSTQQIARTPPWVQHTAPAESPVRNAWANTGAVLAFWRRRGMGLTVTVLKTSPKTSPKVLKPHVILSERPAGGPSTTTLTPRRLQGCAAETTNKHVAVDGLHLLTSRNAHRR